MGKKSNLTHQYKAALKRQCKFGQSKAAAKQEAREYAKTHNTKYEQPRGIYSTKTLKDYDSSCRYFLSYCLAKHNQDIRSWEDCRQFAEEYITGLIRTHSAWTVHLYATAIAAGYDMRVKDLLPGLEMPKRERQDIIRGRDMPSRGLEADERYRTSIELLKATGCRRAEALRLRKEDFRENADGTMSVYKRGKGGLERWCLVNPKFTDTVKEFLKTQPTYTYNGEERLFRKSDLPKSEIHSYRADYARDLYDYYEGQGYATGKLYHCKKEMKGIVFDKGILEKVSYDLQHGRNNVIVSSYLWK